MKWNEQTEIEAPIEEVWRLFEAENMGRIMPQVVALKKISFEQNENITVYEETYREGKHDETYILTEKIAKDTPNEKVKEFSFTIANMIHTEGAYTLQTIAENRTLFVYKGENTGVTFFGRVMLKMAGKLNDLSVVTDFMKLVKKEAEKCKA